MTQGRKTFPTTTTTTTTTTTSEYKTHLYLYLRDKYVTNEIIIDSVSILVVKTWLSIHKASGSSSPMS
ncbi:hypothetical protein PIROE2DRAFT_12496 [Piromyces sp. E2]|nr:hypothetical protein PIROE2DRAFT_12496 [Piromyces sp. E2]|eukprot:OUM61498.1 hypothetical protein PIROE2DRAFT_12496 [Piromyces sp. E2]